MVAVGLRTLILGTGCLGFGPLTYLSLGQDQDVDADACCEVASSIR
jgi:hypothetical protein